MQSIKVGGLLSIERLDRRQCALELEFGALEIDDLSGLERSSASASFVGLLVVEVFVAEVLTQGQTPLLEQAEWFACSGSRLQCGVLDSLMGCSAEVQRAAASSDRRYPALGYDMCLIDLSAHGPTFAGSIFDSRDSFVDERICQNSRDVNHGYRR